MVEEIIDNVQNTASTDVLPDSNDFIGATQNVIIDAAENVSEVFNKTNPDISHQLAGIPFYADVEFWVGMAFILSVIVLAKPACSYLKSAMHKKISNVKGQIDAAIQLRNDAQDLLAQYEKKFKNTDDEIAQILKQAEKNITSQKKNDLELLKESTALKEKEIKRRIESSTENALVEINQSISYSAISLAKKVISVYVKKIDHNNLIDRSIENLDKFIK